MMRKLVVMLAVLTLCCGCVTHAVKEVVAWAVKSERGQGAVQEAQVAYRARHSVPMENVLDPYREAAERTGAAVAVWVLAELRRAIREGRA